MGPWNTGIDGFLPIDAANQEAWLTPVHPNWTHLKYLKQLALLCNSFTIYIYAASTIPMTSCFIN